MLGELQTRSSTQLSLTIHVSLKYANLSKRGNLNIHRHVFELRSRSCTKEVHKELQEQAAQNRLEPPRRRPSAPAASTAECASQQKHVELFIQLILPSRHERNVFELFAKQVQRMQKSANVEFGAVQECVNVVLIFSREKDTCDHVVARRLHTRVENPGEQGRRQTHQKKCVDDANDISSRASKS